MQKLRQVTSFSNAFYGSKLLTSSYIHKPKVDPLRLFNFVPKNRNYSTDSKIELPSFIEEMKNSDKINYKKYDVEWLEKPERKTFKFDEEAYDHIILPEMDRLKLQGGPGREFILVASCYGFPDSRDSPVRFSSVNASYLWLDPLSKQEKILLQLNEHIPPLLWIPLRARPESLERAFKEFISMEANSIHARLQFWEDMYTAIGYNDLIGTGNDEKLLDRMLDYLKNVDPASIPDEHPNTCYLFLGNIEDEKDIEQCMMNNPFVFNTPLALGSSNKHIKGNVIVSKFQTIFSRSVLEFIVRKDLNVELGEATSGAKDFYLPVFVRINYPDNKYMSRPCTDRINKIFGTEYPEDVPIDVVAACFGSVMKSFVSVRNELKNIEEKSADDLPAYSIAHLAILRDPEFDKIFERFYQHEDPIYRIACLKGAAELGLRKQVNMMEKVEKNPEIQELIAKVIENWGD